MEGNLFGQEAELPKASSEDVVENQEGLNFYSIRVFSKSFQMHVPLFLCRAKDPQSAIEMARREYSEKEYELESPRQINMAQYENLEREARGENRKGYLE